jgi:hypothetical protein
MGDDPGVTGDQNGIGKFHWSHLPAQRRFSANGAFSGIAFWYSPGQCGIGRAGDEAGRSFETLEKSA